MGLAVEVALGLGPDLQTGVLASLAGLKARSSAGSSGSYGRSALTAIPTDSPVVRPGGELVPWADPPAADHPMQHERVAADELLGGLAAGDDAHGAAVPGNKGRPSQQQQAAGRGTAPAAPR